MSEDLTKKVVDAEGDKLTLILTIVRKLESHGAMLVQVLDRLDQLADGFEKLVLRVNAVETRLDAVEVRLQSLEQTVRRSVHNLGRGQTVLNDAILKIHIGFLDIDERLQGLERRTSPANSQT